MDHEDATNTTCLQHRLEQLEARLSEIQQLVPGDEDRTCRHVDLVAERLDQRIKLVLTEVRGLAARVDRFTRTRVRGSGSS